ncbi:hypothetical protein COV49_03850 [Candidatus Falkowbacteria bacterium CG11_big_fil_rev_8_21_14_0_20_39_10]|uniref:Uncharacterized protein n=1 Tax=Candidatus Falkowbacteria bacterium CG11_big_fil_rev_8_21_14_0_20_39_10 TaxID=1974570 RepID=A0A2M6K866_9BACT|nr:MAG: hypothetical protein COV49_03850 [Candidatus Falkowbacteria bacterium CG11_big_fil_rev_8_21_14_0_20_39_10]
MILADQPEILSTINIIRPILFKNISLTKIIGLSLIFVIVILFISKNKAKIIKNNFNQILFYLFLAFWLPLFVNHFYNNMYDFKENIENIHLNQGEKTKDRICKIDNYQNLGGSFCQSFSFVNFSRQALPENSNISVLTTPGLQPYFHYYLIPYYKFADKVGEADYLLYNISSPDYYFIEGRLYRKSKIKSEEDQLIGNYRVFNLLNKRQIILQKIAI